MRRLVFFTFLLGCGQAPGEVATTTAHVVSDPAQHTSNEHCGSTNGYVLVHGGVKGRIYHPKNGTCATPIYSPLVVLFRGTGYGDRDYGYLLRHLARNGFIAVSIDVLGENASDHDTAVADARGYMDNFLLGAWAKSPYVNASQVAVMGHSRGAGTARRLAQEISGDPTAPWRVRAIVSLAGVTSGSPHPDADDAEALLFLHGAADVDQSPLTSFIEYDLSGTEDSFAGGFQPFSRTMKLIEGAGHENFSTRGWTGTDQHKVTKGYVMSFLRAHLHGDFTWYDDYVRGHEVPSGYAFGDITTQYSDGLARRVVDNFQDGTVGNNTMGAAVIRTDVNATVEDDHDVIDPLTESRTLHVLGNNVNAHITWRLPSGQRDAEGYRWLSFRIGQMTGAVADDLRVQIRNGTTWSAERRVTNYGPIPEEVTGCVGIAGCQLRSHVGTVLVPLQEFGDHDDVQRIRFRFRGDSAVRWFTIDNVEFAGSIWAP